MQEGYTPLLQASASGHVEVVKALLAAGADVGARDDVGV
jgi:ankyrin repeat protein